WCLAGCCGGRADPAVAGDPAADQPAGAPRACHGGVRDRDDPRANHGPALGGWLTYDYSWRWIFYINLPVGVLCALGILVFIRQTRNVHREPFDFVGFLTLSLGIGALQLMLDRGELKDWFHSSEIWIEATVAGLGFYLFTVHTVTTDGRSFLNRDLLQSANFLAGTALMFCGGPIMTGTNAPLPTTLL